MARRPVRGAVDRIDRRNLIYFTLYNWVNAVFNEYYRKVEVRGLENIPGDAPVIFTPNHQNALMDALIVLFSSPGDTVFLARADLFKKKILAYLLNSLKILPVFRIRDGVEELGKNQEIFDITVGVLHRKHQLCLMPEGNHGDKRRLRRIGKGVFRIAFSTQEKMGNQPYVKIVPVGLDFSDYIKHYQTLYVNYGKPIEVADYWDAYAENPARGTNLLKERFTGEIKKLMIHIETEDFYDLYMGLRTVFNERMRALMDIDGDSLHDRFVADKEMIRRLDGVLAKYEAQPESTGDSDSPSATDPSADSDSPSATGQSADTGHDFVAGLSADSGHPLVQLREKTEEYFNGLKVMNLRDWVVKSAGYSGGQTAWRWLTLVLTFPVFVYGLVNNALVYFLPVRAVRGIKDVQFHSSVKAGLAMLVVVPFSYFIQTLLVGIFTGPWYWWVAYLVTLYPMGKLALWWYFRLKKTLRGSWFRRQVRREKQPATGLIELRENIITDTEKLIGKTA